MPGALAMSFLMSDSNAASEVANVIRYERLQLGSFYADFRRDQRLNPEVYHCVIQREGSNEILRWSQHRSLEGARRTAQAELRRLSAGENTELREVPLQPT
jgi:hypothetical protein